MRYTVKQENLKKKGLSITKRATSHDLNFDAKKNHSN